MKTQADLQSLLRALGTVSFSWRTFELTPDDPPNAPREASKRTSFHCATFSSSQAMSGSTMKARSTAPCKATRMEGKKVKLPGLSLQLTRQSSSPPSPLLIALALVKVTAVS